MSDELPPLVSIELQPPPGSAPSSQGVCWTPSASPDLEAYVYCLVKVPISEGAAGGLFAGGLDLMLRRYILAPGTSEVSDDFDVDQWPHRLVLERTRHGRFSAVADLATRADGDDLPRVGDVGMAADDWTTAPRPPGAGAVASVTGKAGKRAPSYIERPMTVSEGVRMGASARQARADKPASPLEAWNKKVKPRMERGGRLPDLQRPPDAKAYIAAPSAGEVPKPASLAPANVAQERTGPVEIQWVLLGSDALTMHPERVRAAIRTLRGYFKVGLAGEANRAKLQRRADRLGVPLDGLFAMAPDHPDFCRAVGCVPAAIAYLVVGDDGSPLGTRRESVDTAGIDKKVEELLERRLTE